MAQCYKHFDLKERTLIYCWRKEHLSLREMARRLRRSHTSISRGSGVGPGSVLNCYTIRGQFQLQRPLLDLGPVKITDKESS